MGSKRSVPGWLITLGFAGVYAASAFLGRLAVLEEGATLGLFWPAAGVGALWFLVRGGVRPLDLALFAVLTFAVNDLTGSTHALALVLLVANLLQLLLFLWLLHRLRPQLWGVGGSGRIDSTTSLGAYLASAVVATFAGAATGSLGLYLVADQFDVLPSLVWMFRNLAGLLAVGCFGYLVAHWVTFREDRGAMPRARRSMGTEGVLLLVISVAVYLGAFLSNLPLVFPLLSVSVWAGLRFSTLAATAHAFMCGVFAVALTRAGVGPFASLGPTRAALFVQLFIIMIVVMALALATSRDEKTRAAADLERSQREAETQADLFGAVLDSMHDGVMVLDRAGGVMFENPAAGLQLGGTAASSGGEAVRLPAALPDGSDIDPADRPVARALAGQTVTDVDLLLEPEGGRRVMSVSARPLAGDGPHAGSRAVVVFRDVTDDRAQRADLMAFSGAVAHDLRNPLQVVAGWLEQLESDIDGAIADGGSIDLDAARQMVGRAQGASGRMRTLIQDLLDHALAGERSLQSRRIDLEATVREAAVGRDLDLVVGSLPAAWADPTLMRQLFDNLVGNAAKYVAPGVRAQVHVSGRLESADGRVHICVEDNGVGIPEGQHQLVFRQFHRAHAADYSGTGLGLSICQRIVERHGGTIAAHDAPSGQGTVFEFTLPAAGA